jgi:hypothetical protein
MAIGQELSNANYRNQGQSTGLLGGPGAIDGTAQSFWNLADPANLTGKASSGHVLANIFDPGNVFGLNQAANPYGPGGVPGAGANGTPTTLPTLPGVGAPKIYDPNSFGGYAALGAGPYNKMASQMAGKVYKPTLMNPVPAAGKGLVAGPPGGKGGASSTMPISITALAPSASTLKQAK